LTLTAKDVVVTREARADLEGLRSGGDAASLAVAERVALRRTTLRADCLARSWLVGAGVPTPILARFAPDNVHVESLPHGWWMLYTVVRRDRDRFVVLLRIADPSTYRGWFPGA